MKKIYIAGKVTGLERTCVENNFNTLERYFRKKGFEVINPIKLVSHETPWKEAMKICIQNLIDSDLIYPMNNWNQSKGAAIELKIAEMFGIPRMDSVTADVSGLIILEYCDKCRTIHKKHYVSLHE